MTMNDIFKSAEIVNDFYVTYCDDSEPDYDYTVVENVEKAVLALKIIKNKQVDVFRLMYEEYVAQYNIGNNKLTNLEFKLLKEVFQDGVSLDDKELDTIKKQLEY